MSQPASAIADLVGRLDDNLREAFEERAGIRQYDANLPRDHAECLALLDVIRMHPCALSGVTVLQVELDGETLWVLTTDLNRARQHLTDIGAKEQGTGTLDAIVSGQFGHVALLTHLG